MILIEKIGGGSSRPTTLVMMSLPTKLSGVTDPKFAPSVFVIMGAAVWSGGRASIAMRRRVEVAIANARGLCNTLFLPTGGVGKYTPSEARVMAGLLRQAGIAEESILLDEASHDTLSSVRNCARILHTLPGIGNVVICSDAYHLPRCRWLFYLYGIPTRAGQVASGYFRRRPLCWTYYCLREIAALPLDTVLVLMSRIR
jgi:vancomycin permeability regulator SanA